tara:strand:- start:175014 stop:175790 length:777 start_codon:yes stop_codon:yes gene_type:complete
MLSIDIQDGIATISFNNPNNMNAYEPEMAQALLQATEDVKNNDDIRAVCLRGEGKLFCTGGDIQYFSKHREQLPELIPPSMHILKATINNILTMNKPVLASIHGATAGVGLSFVLACDLAISSNDCKFNMAYSNLGLVPDGGATYFLPRIIGQKRAMQLAMLSEVISAEQALDLGLINWTVDAQELQAATQKHLNRLAKAPTQAYAKIKNLINSSWERDLSAQLDAEEKAFIACTQTDDFAEGLSAFLNKQRANFTGQ